MKVIFKLSFISSLLFSSCSLELGSKEKTTVKTLATTCSKEKFNEKDKEDDPKVFTCEFPEFNIFVYKAPTMENKEFVESVYSWFKQNVFYSHEVHTLQGILFDGSDPNGTTFGGYKPFI